MGWKFKKKKKMHKHPEDRHINKSPIQPGLHNQAGLRAGRIASLQLPMSWWYSEKGSANLTSISINRPFIKALSTATLLAFDIFPSDESTGRPKEKDNTSFPLFLPPVGVFLVNFPWLKKAHLGSCKCQVQGHKQARNTTFCHLVSGLCLFD